MYTINLGTGDINDAVYNVEYTNHAGGTYWSDLRKKYGHGVSLQTAVECEKYDLESFAIDDTHKYHEQDGVDFIDSAAAYDAASGELTVFVINRDWEDCADFTLDITGLSGMRFEGHMEMFTENRTLEDGANKDLSPVPATDTVCDDMKVKAELKPLSWNVFRFVKA